MADTGERVAMVRANEEPITWAGLSVGKVGVAYLVFCAPNSWLQLNFFSFIFFTQKTNTKVFNA